MDTSLARCLVQRRKLQCFRRYKPAKHVVRSVPVRARAAAQGPAPSRYVALARLQTQVQTREKAAAAAEMAVKDPSVREALQWSHSVFRRQDLSEISIEDLLHRVAQSPLQHKLGLTGSSKLATAATEAQRRAQRRRAESRHRDRRRSVEAASAAVAVLAGLEPAAAEAAAMRALQVERLASAGLAGSSSGASGAGIQVPPPHALQRRLQRELRRDTSALTLLLRQANAHPLLSREEEAELVVAMQEGERIAAAGQALTERLGREPAAQELAAEVGAATEFEVNMRLRTATLAHGMLLRGNLRLVVRVAKSSHWRDGVELEDLVYAGIHGLEKGLRKFDTARGYKLSTYVYWWIYDAVTNAQEELARSVALPRKTLEQITKVRKVSARYSTTHQGRSPSKEEVMEMTGYSATTVLRVLKATRLQEHSLETETAPAGPATSTRQESAADAADDLVHAQALHAPEPMPDGDVRRVVEEMLGQLPAREAMVMRHLYGLAGAAPTSRKSLGQQMSISTSRVFQLQRRAMQRLRQSKLLHVAAQLA